MKNTYKIVASLAGVALLIAMVVIPLWAFSQIKEAAEARKHTYLIINRAENLLSELRDAETGQRGYSLPVTRLFWNRIWRCVTASVAIWKSCVNLP